METRRDSGQLLWGILLVVLGLLFLSGNFGYWSWFAWGRWWPLLLIALGVIMLYRRGEHGGSGAITPGSPSTAGPGHPGEVAPGEAAPRDPTLPPAQPAVGGPPPARRNPIGALVLIGIGVAFLLDEVVGGNAFPAFVLIAIGVALLVRQRAEAA